MASPYDNDITCDAVYNVDNNGYGGEAEFLTVQDVKEIFEVIMPKSNITNEEILHLIP